MKTVFSLFLCIFSLYFFFGCGETEEPVVAEKPRPLLMSGPSLDIKYYPKGWVRLTDSDVVELLTFKFPDNLWETKDLDLLEKYFDAEALRTHGDTQHVRFYIEWRRNKVSTPELLAAFARTVYFLWPNENNKFQLDRVLQNLPKYVDPSDLEPPRRQRGRQLTVKEIKEIHTELLAKHGNIPEVQIVADFYMRNAQHQPVTFDEIFAYRQAKFKLEPDHKPNLVLLEAYLQAKANGQPLHTVDERKVLDEWLQGQEE